MKLFRLILFTYFRQHFFGVVSFLMAFLLSFVATINVLGHENAGHYLDSTLSLYFISAILISYNIAQNLRRLIDNQSFELLPGYRFIQVIVSGIIFCLFTVMPCLFLDFYGIAFTKSLSLLLFNSMIIIWLFFRFGDNIINITVIVWIARSTYEILGYGEKNLLFSFMYDVKIGGSALFLEMAMIIIAIAGLWYFVKYFLHVPLYKISKQTGDASNPWTKDHDKADKLVFSLIMRQLNKFYTGSKSAKKGLITHAKYFQYALFSPGNVVLANSIITLSIMMLYILTVIHIIIMKEDIMFNDIIVFSYYLFFILAGMFSTEFIQHRGRLPMLWMQSGIRSRKSFTKAVVLSYFLIVSKTVFLLSAMILCIPLFVESISFSMLLPSIIMSLIINIAMPGLTLLFSPYIESPDGRGWTIGATMFGMLILGIHTILEIKILRGTPAEWYVLAGLGIISILFLIGGIKKWEKTEFDFASV